ncbi:MAG: aminopeptidase P family protein, partial [Verrucomicrobiae bacterium]|nr:aminopeptidase P family protein [Verrucomicrobiae bacterium]
LNQPIIIKICVRSQKTGYHGLITRTMVKGHATDPFRKLYTAVLAAQELGLQTLAPGVPASYLCDLIQAYFNQSGFSTLNTRHPNIPSPREIGHGLGLQPIEPPELTRDSTRILMPAHVIALQPCLRQPQIGTAQIQDVVVFTTKGARALTRFQKSLEL